MGPTRLRLRPVMGECDQIGWQRGDDAIHEPVTRRLFAQILCEATGLAADHRNRKGRLLERDAFDGLPELGRNLAVLAGVCSPLSREGGQAKLPLQRHPALGGSERDPSGPRNRLQRAVILQMRLKQAEPI